MNLKRGLALVAAGAVVAAGAILGPVVAANAGTSNCGYLGTKISSYATGTQIHTWDGRAKDYRPVSGSVQYAKGSATTYTPLSTGYWGVGSVGTVTSQSGVCY